MNERRTVTAAEAEAATGEQLETVEVFLPGVAEPFVTIPREKLTAIDLADGAVAWKDPLGKIHRLVGVTLHTVHAESRILRPA